MESIAGVLSRDGFKYETFEEVESTRKTKDLEELNPKGRYLADPKGSKDSKQRPKSGYILREAKKRQTIANDSGIYKSVENYL